MELLLCFFKGHDGVTRSIWKHGEVWLGSRGFRYTDRDGYQRVCLRCGKEQKLEKELSGKK